MENKQIDMNEQQWIPVGERLPERTEPFMWYNDDNVREVLWENYETTVLAYDPGIGIFKAKFSKGDRWTEISSVSINSCVKPTHWCPLPDPPQDIQAR